MVVKLQCFKESHHAGYPDIHDVMTISNRTIQPAIRLL
jgi:hypothetical protein